MTFTAINHTDLAAQAARIDRGDFASQRDRVRAHQISSRLQRASEEIEEARAQLPEIGIEFHGAPD